MYLSRRSGRFDCGERLQNTIVMLRPGGHHPGVSRLQPYGLPRDLQFSPSGDDVANHLVLVLMRGLVLGRFLIPSQPHGDPFA
jgi:hypothetical protein